jgi:hypothetical protein
MLHGADLYVVAFTAALAAWTVAKALPGVGSGAVASVPGVGPGNAEPSVTPKNLIYNVVSTPGALYRNWRQGQTGDGLTRLLVVGNLPGGGRHDRAHPLGTRLVLRSRPQNPNPHTEVHSRAMTAAPDLAFYDAWAVAEDGTVGTDGRTAILLAQSAPTQARRFDFNFSAWLRRGGVGNPRHLRVAQGTSSRRVAAVRPPRCRR